MDDFTFNFDFSEQDKEIFPFLDLDARIAELSDKVVNHREKITGIELDYANRHNEILAKIEKLRQQLANINTERYKEIDKARAQHDTDVAELAALRKQKKEEEANKAFESTVELIKEIAADFAAWHNARDYQVEDIVRIVHQYTIGSAGIMNANEMALGKTFETLCALFICMELFRRTYKKEPAILWLTKNSIVQTGGTFNEAKRWFPELKIFPVKSDAPKASKELVFDFAKNGGMCVLTNYETIKVIPKAKDIRWDFLIMDEVHKLKGGANSSGPTQIWEAVKALDVGFQMMLTGTPLVNRIEEIWSYLHLFDPLAFPSSKQFARQFSGFKDMSGKLQFSLQSERLLKDILKGRLIRRTATEVGLQLPPVNFQRLVIPHNLEQGPLYEKMRKDFFIWLAAQEKAVGAMGILAQLTRLRQINVLPVATFKIKDADGNIIEEVKLDVRDSSKLDEAMEIIDQTNDQVIVFSNFLEPMEELAFRLQVEGKRSRIISSKHEYSTVEEEFQAGNVDVLMITLGMGEGLNLHKDKAKWEGGARAVIFLDKWWNDARNDQAVKRAVRPGETAGEPVFVYELFCENSVDFFIQALCDEKSQQFGNLTEDSSLRPSAEWAEYLKGLL